DAQCARVTAATAAARDAGGNADAAVATATTDGLRDDAMRVRTRGQRIAGAHELDVVTVAATAAEAAHADAGRHRRTRGKIHRTTDVQAAIAATAAQRLDEHAIGFRTAGCDAPGDL